MSHTATLQDASQHTVEVALERFPAAQDLEEVTQQTINLMCRYVRESADDPAIQRAAEYAAQHYGCGSNDPAMLAWAAFWFAKHNVKFVVDEAPMFRLGEPNQQDLLISPSVLIRMRNAQEDCDGFTMLVCALLRALGVPFVIVTIAASPDDPARWSHVFAMALTPAPIPLDASHGPGPGWCVPASHTFRWQAWDADGNPVNVPLLRKTGLHGWVPSDYGLGQACVDSNGNPIDCPSSITETSVSTPASSTPDTGVSETSYPIVLQSSSTPSSSSFNWTSFLNTLTNDAAGVAKVAETTSAATSASLALSGAFSSLLPIIAVLVIGGFAISMLESHK